MKHDEFGVRNETHCQSEDLQHSRGGGGGWHDEGGGGIQGLCIQKNPEIFSL